MRATGDDRSVGDRLLRVALDSMPYGFSVWDSARRLILVNQHYLDMYRFTPETVRVGMSLREVCEVTVALGNHPGFAIEGLFDLYNKRLDEASDPAKPLVSEKAVRGRVIRTSHCRSPELDGWIIIHEDITEQTEQQWMAELREKSLADQNLRFDAALSHMSHGLSM